MVFCSGRQSIYQKSESRYEEGHFLKSVYGILRFRLIINGLNIVFVIEFITGQFWKKIEIKKQRFSLLSNFFLTNMHIWLSNSLFREWNNLTTSDHVSYKDSVKTIKLVWKKKKNNFSKYHVLNLNY